MKVTKNFLLLIYRYMHYAFSLLHGYAAHRNCVIEGDSCKAALLNVCCVTDDDAASVAHLHNFYCACDLSILLIIQK